MRMNAGKGLVPAVCVAACIGLVGAGATLAVGSDAGELEALRLKVEKAQTAADAAPEDVGAAVVLAEALAEQALWLRENHNPGWKDIANAALQRAEGAYEARQDVSTMLALARVWAARGSFGKAIDYAEDAVEAGPADPKAHIGLGDVLAQRGRAIVASRWRLGRITRNRITAAADAALEAYGKALVAAQAGEMKALAHLRMGSVYLDLLGDEETADSQWRSAIKAAPDSDTAERAKDLLAQFE